MSFIFSPFYIPVIFLLVLIYWVVLKNPKHRLLLVCFASLITLAFIHPVFATIMIGTSYLLSLIGRMIIDKKLSVKNAIIIAITLGVLILAIGKYGKPILSSMLPADDWIFQYLIVPLGLSWFVLRVVGYIIDVIRRQITEISFINILAYLSFFPILPAGPLETYSGFYNKRSESFDKDLFYSSLRRIPIGFFKKIIIVNTLYPYFFGDITNPFFSENLDLASMHPLAAWGFVIVLFTKAYLDISAYTDIAVGVSGLFGFRIMEDLNFPLVKRNLSEFWRSWHISIMNWCRDRVYFPVYGATRNVALGIYASLMVMGLWHYVNLNWFAWAIYQASGLTFLFYWNQLKRKYHKFNLIWHSKILKPVGYIITFLFASMAFAIMAPYEPERALIVFKACLTSPFLWISEF